MPRRTHPAPMSIDMDDQPPRILWPLVVALFAAAFVLRFAYFYLDDLTRQMHGTLLPRLLEEGTGVVAALLLFPIAVWLERRFPLDRGRWHRTWLVHTGGFVLYSTLHTTMLATTRWTLFPALGLGSYDYGILSVRYLMESAQDFISYATFIGILTLVRVQQRLHNREIRTATLERDTANARLEALSLRLQPHFLFNALNTISSTVYQDPVAADELIGRLGELLRQALRTTERQEIPLGEELGVLQAYMALIEARFGDRIRFVTDIPDQIATLAVPAFLLQPLVENAVHHGASREYGDTEILVRGARRGATLELVIENDSAEGGAGPPRIGTGLGTTRDRLALLYGANGSLHAESGGGHFRVTIRLPARDAEPAPAALEPEDARAHR